MKKLPLLIVAGPTASGKTRLGIELAKLYDGEVVSADSMQIYKGLDIATAKPSAEEMQGIPHHLIGILEPDTAFSVADYLRLARDCIEEIASRGKLPVLVGGTGLYITSLIDNIRMSEIRSDETVRSRIAARAELDGGEALLRELDKVDHETAKTLHPNNLPRIIRALEVYELTGETMTAHRIRSREAESEYSLCYIGLNAHDRQFLYDRINLRVDIMVQNGLAEEARAVYTGCKLKTAHQAIGYKELIPYFEGNASLEECLERIKQETRRYAKRQLTWFRRDERIDWIYIDEDEEFEKIIEKSKKNVANSKIICYN